MHNLTVKFLGDSKREREKKQQHTERFSVVLLVVVVTLDFSDESPVNPWLRSSLILIMPDRYILLF
jgi:hypothetical protein